MKDDFYRDRLIVQIAVYSILHWIPLIFLILLFKIGGGGFIDPTDYILMIFSEISLPFAAFVSAIILLIQDFVKRKKSKHVFEWTEFSLSLIAFTVAILVLSVFPRLLDGEIFFCFEIGLVVLVWILWIVEFIVSHKTSAVKENGNKELLP